ncbi:MAG TPA: 2Fe-2S iron-sulfur cluster-binding protein [Phycisphaerae bacterium]|nr:2Fe-2S iron-sulfur cluster-binding protein [Phycisphaerae bacterium]
MVVLALIAVRPALVAAQVSPEEHASHHPEESQPENSASQPAGDDDQKKSGGMGGMAGGMGKMMEKMGAPKPKELYPSLMALPDLPMEMRQQIQRQAHDRMKAGAALMSEGLEALSRAAPSDDFKSMQVATAKLREGLAEFESGLAAHRALAEGKAPRNVALRWFKREMNLLPATHLEPSFRFWGMSTFHTFVMVIFVVFAAVMIWMYYFKMRRASALLQSLVSPGIVAAPGVTRPAEPQESTPSAAVQRAPQSASAERQAVPKPVEPPEFPAMKSRTVPAQTWSGNLRVCRIFEETPGVKTFRLAAEHDVALPFTYYPGQFLTLSLNIDGKKVKRSYTIASTPTQLHYCAITVKREDQGLVSRFLHDQIEEENLLEAAAPNGKFTFTGAEAETIVLIGGGVGITPLMSVVRYLTDVGWRNDIYLLYCCRTTKDFIFREELEQLQQRHPNLHVFATMTRAAGTVWMGLKGRFTSDLIGHLIPDVSKCRVHVCGPPLMMSAVLEMLKTLNVPDDQLETEAFGPAIKPPSAKSVASAATEAQPGTVPSSGDAKSVGTTAVAFKRSDKFAPLATDETVLDAADAVGVEIDNSCRSGQCGLCKIKLLSGNVTMECDDALSDDDKQQGLILACQAMASANVEVDA